LEARRGAFRRANLPKFTIDQILQWADLHFESHGAYPITTDGIIEAAPSEKWSSVDSALQTGNRGLPGGTTLSRLLHERRGKYYQASLPRLTEEQILGWMDEHYARTGEWPTLDSGVVQACPSENWHAVDGGLYKGLRGLPGKTSLTRLAILHRGRPDLSASEPLTREMIAQWIVAHTSRHGQYPTRNSGPVEDAEGELWITLNTALEKGYRSLPGGDTIAGLREELIAQKRLPELPRRIPRPRPLDRLTIAKIADWMQAYATLHGQYPTRTSGDVDGSKDDTWTSVEDALINGRRGLPGGQNLSILRRELIDQRRLPSSPYICKLPSGITKEQIAEWTSTYGRSPRTRTRKQK